eukprot:SAG31_NODE_813_length_11892_cov_5.354538_5_plen_155_part_00
MPVAVPAYHDGAACCALVRCLSYAHWWDWAAAAQGRLGFSLNTLASPRLALRAASSRHHRLHAAQVTFTLDTSDEPPPCGKVYIAGTFNDWQPEPMEPGTAADGEQRQAGPTQIFELTREVRMLCVPSVLACFQMARLHGFRPFANTVSSGPLH